MSEQIENKAEMAELIEALEPIRTKFTDAQIHEALRMMGQTSSIDDIKTAKHIDHYSK